MNHKNLIIFISLFCSIIRCSQDSTLTKPQSPEPEGWTDIQTLELADTKDYMNLILQDPDEKAYWKSINNSVESALASLSSWIKDNCDTDFIMGSCLVKLPIHAAHETVLMPIVRKNKFKEFIRQWSEERATRWIDRALGTAIAANREENTRLLLEAAQQEKLLDNLPGKTRVNAAEFLQKVAHARQQIITEKVSSYLATIQNLAELIRATHSQTPESVRKLLTNDQIAQTAESMILNLTQLASKNSLPKPHQ